MSGTPRKTEQTPAEPKPAPEPGAPLGLEDLKALIALVAREPFQEFEFEHGPVRFRIRKDAAAPPPPRPAVPGAAPRPLAPAPPAAEPVEAEEPGLHYITSPIVGTFYRAPNPAAAPFVDVGDRVKPGQVLCIVEAMKLMNEIESDRAGELVKVLVESGQPVEYGERLFALRTP